MESRFFSSNITAEEGMDAAFAFVEAGPAAGAFVFAVGSGAGAGLAADGAVAECGESVHGEVVFFDVVLDFVASPGGHGVELHDVKVAEDIEVVEFHDFSFFARVVLLAADSGDPDIECGEFFLQGNDFAKGTAEVGLGFPKLGAEVGGLLFDGLFRDERLDGDGEAFLDGSFQLMRFRKEEAGVDGEDRKIQAVGEGLVHNDKARSLKAGADCGARAEFFPCPGQNLAQTRGFQLLSLATDFLGIEFRRHQFRN